MYILIAIKFILGTMVMILQINLSGKVDFAVNTPLNQIQNYILGGIIGGVIYNSSITIIQFMIIHANMVLDSNDNQIFTESEPPFSTISGGASGYPNS